MEVKASVVLHQVQHLWNTNASPLALFATWTESWVGNLTWTTDTWHCWGAAGLGNPTGNGRHLVIFDCEANMSQDFTTVRHISFMLSTWVAFIKWAANHCLIETVGYRNASIIPVPLHCILHTVTWINTFARIGTEVSGTAGPLFAFVKTLWILPYHSARHLQ